MLSRLRATLKGVGRRLLGSKAGFALARRLLRQRGFRVLSFHRVVPDETPAHDYRRRLGDPTVSEFESLIAGLRERIPILPLAELAARAPHWGHGFALGVCFDDGHREVATLAAPVLERLQVPYTVFLTTDCMTGYLPWFSRVYLLAYADRGGEPFRMPDRVEPATTNARALERSLVSYLRRLDTREMHQQLDEIEELNPWYRPPSDLRQLEAFMNWGDVRDLIRSGLAAFGSHTRAHPDLTGLTEERLQEELAGSCQAIAREAGQAPVLIAYPNGLFHERIEPALEAAGLRAGFLMTPGLNGVDTRRFQFHREYVPAERYAAFTQVSGVNECFRRRGRT